MHGGGRVNISPTASWKDIDGGLGVNRRGVHGSGVGMGAGDRVGDHLVADQTLFDDDGAIALVIRARTRGG